ncbi:zinc-binding protein [Candidatus Shapirobacteria bacterium CG08_land_8_20_14_0_20_39_18]|uniref:Zinc-binding protein n=1 Tax=Candidatus Shapirobacteria bacterium CG08_land_8_20_14_0_20_39_18 TaxID=1974883 RepID=A0A2M6XCB3_9BACT|nr:MAG: zinc-binding protein [Candidatus Shapirobacteria bacterium CG08_land_8_20_14_0_20_39_18]PIY65581.1 MAG: zinc-binding protein [Candidatus Shapirobacteria bacterium CG_4_10_14_0_8_um_filter_39_15]PJE68799.1 MAG: zinc-binding protein [Candidatus Shapirobacteria bacterium CG10_big_fil_rev_8_21_14_0_10_38_8]
MAFADQNLKCRDCGADFVWTASEQEFYQQKGFTNAPVRCPACRQAKKQERMTDRKMYPITCAQCGKTDEVPFEPRGDRPVLCKDCFKKSKETGGPAAA